jgi:hypothetical protein
MAKKKQPISQLPLPPPPDDDDDLVADVPPREAAGEGDADAELAEALGELRDISGATVTVNRVNEQGKEELLDRWPALEFDLYSIRDNYGPGTYWIYGRDGKQLRKKGRVIFARTLDEQRLLASGRPGGIAAAAPPATDLLALFERQAQQNRDMMQMFVQLNRAPATDPATIIDLASKLATMGNRGNNNGGGSFEDFMRIAKFVREFGGGGGGGDGAGLIGFGREIVSALRERENSSQPQLAPNGQAPTGEAQVQFLIKQAISRQLPVLIRGAQAESDPAVYAQLLLDQVPDLYLRPLLRELQKPEWFSLLVSVSGAVVPHQAWFEALRNEVLSVTSQDPPPPT